VVGLSGSGCHLETTARKSNISRTKKLERIGLSEADVYMEKPFEPQTLLGEIERQLAKKNVG